MERELSILLEAVEMFFHQVVMVRTGIYRRYQFRVVGLMVQVTLLDHLSARNFSSNALPCCY